MKIPEAVVVDTATGHTIAEDLNRQPFTVDVAVRFAEGCNAACKPEYRTYRVFKLVPVEDSGTTHEHNYQGQTFRHAHPGGDQEHGYFEHPEDIPIA